MKKFAFWKRIAVLALVMIGASIFGYYQLSYSEAFQVVSAEYKSQFPNDVVKEITLCGTCQKRISFGGGIKKYRFTILVLGEHGRKEVSVVYTVDQKNNAHDVVFEKKL